MFVDVLGKGSCERLVQDDYLETSGGVGGLLLCFRRWHIRDVEEGVGKINMLLTQVGNVAFPVD